MASCDEFIQRIVSRCGIMPSRVRRDLERELRAHLEDAIEYARAQGYDESQIFQIVCDRFGHPDEIARALAKAHRLERTVMIAVSSVALFGTSLAAIGTLILSLQLIISIFSGASIMKSFPFLPVQIAGFMSLTLGYTGLFLAERMFQKKRLAKALVTNSVVFSILFTVAFLGWHLTTFAPVLAFVCGLSVRTLQHTVLQRIWFIGAAVPLAIATALNAGPLLSTTQGPQPWAAALVRWIGISMACHVLTRLSKKHEARMRDLAAT